MHSNGVEREQIKVTEVQKYKNYISKGNERSSKVKERVHPIASEKSWLQFFEE